MSKIYIDYLSGADIEALQLTDQEMLRRRRRRPAPSRDSAKPAYGPANILFPRISPSVS